MGKQLEEKSEKMQAAFNYKFLKLNQKLKGKELDEEVKEALEEFKVAAMNIKNTLKEVLEENKNKPWGTVSFVTSWALWRGLHSWAACKHNVSCSKALLGCIIRVYY